MTHSLFSIPNSLFPVSVLILSLAACTIARTPTLPVPATPTSLFPEAPSSVPSPTGAVADTLLPATTLPVPTGPELTVTVIVDSTTEQVTREQAEAAVDQASGFLREFAPIGLHMVDFVSDGLGGSTSDMAGRYLSLRSALPPDGIVIFSTGDQGQARASGGYGYSMPAPAGFKSRFVSPAAGDRQIYIAVVDYGYKYMACGYGGADQVKSASSLPGECRGHTGIPCVQANGYSICSNAVGNLYTATPTYAVSSMIVHGLLHNFGPNGDQDHYATPECNARMGYPAAFFDLQESEYYNGLCPFVYEEFAKSYRP
jgi:hypothetical protein